jgi:hypothetical protein
MPVANRFGINLGEIQTQASNIKTAKLSREKNQLAVDRTKAGIKLRERALGKKSNALIDESAQGEGEGIFPTAEELPQEEVNRLQALAPDVAKDIAKTQQVAAQTEALKRMYMAKGETEDDATYKSNLDVQDVADFEKIYTTKDKANQAQIRDNIAQQGRLIQSVLEIAQQNPQQANKMFLDYRTDNLKAINELRKNGKNEEADQMEKGLKRLPETLITPDGKFNAGFLTMSLAKLNSMLTTAESYTESQSEAQKQANKLALEREKQKAPSTRGTKKEFQQLMDALDKEKDPKKRKMIQSRLTKLSQPSMQSDEVKRQTANRIRGEFATKVNVENPFALATVDTRSWTPEQRAEANTVASQLVRATGQDMKTVNKKIATYGAMLEQSKNAIESYSEVGEFRLLDETTKKYFSNYFGLSEEELESTEAAQAFQSLQNISIKADSGSAVSAQEMVRKTLEVATPTMTKSRILMGIKNLAKRNIGELKGLKSVMGDVAFNLKYGHILRNYEEIASASKETSVKKGDKLAELRKGKQTPRQTKYDQIKAQRPNATDTQINNYLTSKGY